MKKREFRSRRQGFTLVELMVVIAIGAMLLAITLGGYRSIATGNQRVSCQTNLTQIYAALRQYSSDYDGFAPYYNPTTLRSGERGLGLWALYAMPQNGSFRDPASPSSSNANNLLPGGLKKPIGLYLRNYKQMHCPVDFDNEERFDANGEFIQAYFSYQGLDDRGDTNASNDEQTYQSSRVLDATNRYFDRQLLRYTSAAADAQPRSQRSPADNTVVTWCRWHRFQRPIDNVLFYDGVVRPTPVEQSNPAPVTGEPATLVGWIRKP
jgi:prepilin-type N-terminal cleavage/methylation domain-containing protein